MVTTPHLGVEGADFELDATATIPDDGWTVETVEE